MRKLTLYLLCLCFSLFSYAQKPPIDIKAMMDWPKVAEPKISNDGNFALYTIQNQPVNRNTLVVKSLHADKTYEIIGAEGATFTSNSRAAMFFLQPDTIGRLDLNTFSVSYIRDCKPFKLDENGRLDDWLCFYKISPGHDFVIEDCNTGRTRDFSGVIGYKVSGNGAVLAIQKTNGDSGDETLVRIDLRSDSQVTVWRGKQLTSFILDDKGTKLAYTVGGGLWIYREGNANSQQLATDRSAGIDSGLSIAAADVFSKDGDRVFFSLKEKRIAKVKDSLPEVDIWSYTDPKPQSAQLAERNFTRTYKTVVNLKDGAVIQLEKPQDDSRLLLKDYFAHSWQIVIERGPGEVSESSWNKTSWNSAVLVSCINGRRVSFGQDHLHKPNPNDYYLSPGEKYVVWYDRDSTKYFSYSIVTGVTKDISGGMKFSEAKKHGSGIDESNVFMGGVSGWLQNDRGVVLCDTFDLWMVDPAGNGKSVNLTNGYGARKRIVFRFTDENLNIPIKEKEVLTLKGFDRVSRQDGFYRITYGKAGDPDVLICGDYIFEGPDWVPGYIKFKPLKARDKDVYIIQRMSFNEEPNYYYTVDFKHFMPLSTIDYQDKYNWLTASLVTWKTLDGRITNGILYRPGNFDEKKKYPVIVHMYEQFSDGIYSYIYPEVQGTSINIPYYVSNGYLVLLPDIVFFKGEPGRSCYDVVESAYHYLARQPYVDSSKIGIEGHSFGGYEVNYLVTHSGVFAAAASAAGSSDLISHYGGFSFGVSNQSKLESHGQYRLGATPWQRLDLYIKNSALFSADKVVTPLLLTNNKGDDIVSYSQGLELFMALRRLGKRAWLLQYDKGTHGVAGEVAQKDYCIRVKQFFDHYLKGMPAPKWMTQGIPATMKRIESGYEADSTVSTPGPGLY